MCNHYAGYLGKLFWLITALSALAIGLRAIGWFDLYALPWMQTDNVKLYLEYTIGVAGVWSLLSMIRKTVACSMGMCHCECLKKGK